MPPAISPADVSAALRSITRTLSAGGRTLDLSPVLGELGEIIVESVKRNFDVGGRVGTGYLGGGSGRWIPSLRATLTGGGKTLVDTGRLRDSVGYTLSGKNTLSVGTNVVYAAIHHFGGVIAPKTAPALVFRLPGKLGVRRVRTSVTIPARPFLVLQNEDLSDMVGVIAEHYAAIVATLART